MGKKIRENNNNNNNNNNNKFIKQTQKNNFQSFSLNK